MTLDSNGREGFLISMLQSMALGDRVRFDLHSRGLMESAWGAGGCGSSSAHEARTI